jgi:hypothetical protein
MDSGCSLSSPDFRWLVLGRLPQVELPTLRSQPHLAVIPSSERSADRSPVSGGVRDAHGDELRPAHNSGLTVSVDPVLREASEGVEEMAVDAHAIAHLAR